jgi:hypothetical protein
MDHGNYNERVEATLAPSRRARAFAATASLATMALAFALPIAAELRALAAAWAAIAALHALHRLRGRCRVTIERSGAVRVDGIEGLLRPGSFVAPWLAIVRWRPAGARWDRTLLVAPDMLGREEFRRLRVLLRWSSPGQA